MKFGKLVLSLAVVGLMACDEETSTTGNDLGDDMAVASSAENVSGADNLDKNLSGTTQSSAISFSDAIAKSQVGEQVCKYNGNTYDAGATFAAEDGCNECVCDETGQVACTEIACEDQESFKGCYSDGQTHTTFGTTKTVFKVYNKELKDSVTLAYEGECSKANCEKKLKEMIFILDKKGAPISIDPIDPIDPIIPIEIPDCHCTEDNLIKCSNTGYPGEPSKCYELYAKQAPQYFYYSYSCSKEDSLAQLKSASDCLPGSKEALLTDHCSIRHLNAVPNCEKKYVKIPESGTPEYWEYQACQINPEGIMCPNLFEPVCGWDNTTYPNSCVAKTSGVGVMYKGSCKKEILPL